VAVYRARIDRIFTQEKMMNDQDQDLELLTTEEIAQILKIEPRTVRSYITQGKLPAVELEGSYRVYRRDLKEFLAQRYKRPGAGAEKKE
jgi:excisionase family DNA binding protein